MDRNGGLLRFVQFSPNRTDALIPVLAVLVILAAALTQVALANTNFRGDEYSYMAGGSAIGSALAGRLPWADALHVVLGTGWFMPGASILAAPVHVFVAKPSLILMRLWMALVNLTLLALAVRAGWKALGPCAALALMIYPGLVAAGHVAMITVLPDFPAGMIALLALMAGYRIALVLAEGGLPRLRELLLLELLLAAGIAMRDPLVINALAIHFILATVVLCSNGRKGAGLMRLVGGLALLAAIIAPWSIAASRHFGTTVVTTTNFPLVIADSFGDPAKTCFGPCAPGSDIWPAWHFAQDNAAATGRNPLDVQRDMMAASLQGLTVSDYVHSAKAHFATFLFDRTGVLRELLPEAFGLPPVLRAPLLQAVSLLSSLVFLPFLAALFAANLGLFRASSARRLQSVLIKASTACMFLQPFIHKTSARYWTTFAPLAAWSAVLLWQSLRDRRRALAPSAVSSESSGASTLVLAHVLDSLQLIYAGLFLAIAVILIWS